MEELRDAKQTVDLQHLVAQAERIKPVSGDLTRLLAMLQEDAGGSKDLERLLMSEPVLVMQVMRLANSPFYRRPGGVDNVASACALLGRNTIRNLVQAVIARSMLSGLQPVTLNGQLFWQHCLYTASISSSCAESCGQPPGGVFTTGLFHDFGLLLLDCLYPEVIRSALDAQSAASDRRLSDLVKEQAGIDHRTFMAHLFRQWSFPDCICSVFEESCDIGRQAAAMLHFACDTACCLGHGITPDNQLLDFAVHKDSGFPIVSSQVPAIIQRANLLYGSLATLKPGS